MPSTNSGPGGAWPQQTGNDFLPNHLANGIDYASIHMWPDNWGRTDKGFGQTWLSAHIADTKYLGKPLVLEEFGKAVGAYFLSYFPDNVVDADAACLCAAVSEGLFGQLKL